MTAPGQRLDTAIMWFRRDLRTADNPALVGALNSARHVVPVFLWTPEEEGQFQPGRQTRWWSQASVACLAARLEQLGSRLVVRRGRESAGLLRQLVEETGAQAVFFNHLYDAISMVRDQQVKDELRAAGIHTCSFNADLLYEPWEVLDEAQQPYTTFKSYWDRCLAMPYAPPLPLPEPAGPLPPVPAGLAGLGVDEVDWFMSAEQEASTEALAHRWDPSGAAAVARLERFLDEGLPCFAHDRAKTDRESTTMLSPWIHFGSISVRHIYYRVAQKHAEWAASGLDKGKSCLDFLQQMGYREYSRYLAFHWPFITERSMLAHLRAVPWRLDQDAFKAWRQGLTGYPLVDAGMRQLWSMGWCHNRVRVVASHFLVKHLLLPWQWGLKHLWDAQIDADLECDALGWQYISGCLADAHPFNHLINLEDEWRRFDPDGNYVRRWLPVLSQLPTQFIHQPWAAPPETLEAAGVELGLNYPWPIVTPDAAREGVALAAAVVERCAAGGASGSSGASSGTGFGGALGPRKEPYRPPTDPALMSSFLAASREGAAWQERLPPLYIHSASGHPLSMAHSAQQRPLWGPALRSASGLAALDAFGRRYGLQRGRLGQQQLLPASSERSGSGSVEFGGASSSSSGLAASDEGAAAAPMAEDEPSSSGRSGEQQQQQQQQRRLHAQRHQRAPGERSGGSPGARQQQQQQQADSEGVQVVPSASEALDELPGLRRAGGSAWPKQGRYGAAERWDRSALADQHQAMSDDSGSDSDDDSSQGSWGGPGGAQPAGSVVTACSGVAGRAAAAAAAAGGGEGVGEASFWQARGPAGGGAGQGPVGMEAEASAAAAVPGPELGAETAARLQQLDLARAGMEC